MIHFVGAGPGAEDLITLRGARLLREADVIIYAGSLVNQALLRERKETCVVYDSATRTLEEVIALLRDADGKGQEVVRLHSGDPSLFGAVREQMDRLRALGIPFDSTPGVSSFCAAAAAMNAEYTLPGVSQTLVITRMGGRTPVPEQERLRELARHGCSMAIFLSASLVMQVQEELLLGAYREDTPAAIVRRASWQDERILFCTVGTLAETAEKCDVQKTALFLVGDFLGASYERSLLYHPAFSTEYRMGEGPACGTSQERTGSAEAEPVRHLACLAFTDRGEVLAGRIAEALGGEVARCGEATGVSLSAWTAAAFTHAARIVYVGATGIATRAVAPYVDRKERDPAVVVVDETGRFAIPILSGHLGGANDLARKIAGICGGTAVITTATDAVGAFAVDEWARWQGLFVQNPRCIKPVSAKILAGEVVRVCSPWEICGARPALVEESAERDADVVLTLGGTREARKTALLLVPRIAVLGVGCRRGVSAERLAECLREFLDDADVCEEAIAAVATIDFKRKEPGLIAFCERRGLPFCTFSAEALRDVPGSFSSSDFVEGTVGVDNVCERSAVAASDGELIVRKRAMRDVTMALAVRRCQLDWRFRDE